MKRPVFQFLLLFLLISSLAFAQNSPSGTSPLRDCPTYEWNQSWNPKTEAWQVNSKLEYSYTGKHAPDQIVQLLSNNGRLEQQVRKTRTFDVQGRMLTQLIENNEEGKWQFSEQNIYAFDQNDANSEFAQTFWSYGTWNSITKTRNTILSEINGQVRSEMFQRWDSDKGGFVDVVRTTNFFNEKGEIDGIRMDYVGENGIEIPFSLEKINAWEDYASKASLGSQTYLWNRQTKHYELARRQSFRYAEGVLKEYSSEDFTHGIAMTKTIRNYDSNGFLLADDNYEWHDGWKLYSSKRWEYAYNEAGKVTEIVLSSLSNGEFQFNNGQLFGDCWE